MAISHVTPDTEKGMSRNVEKLVIMKKIKLTNLAELSSEEKKELLGGINAPVVPGCGCGCRWADQGGSSTSDNLTANFWLGIP